MHKFYISHGPSNPAQVRCTTFKVCQWLAAGQWFSPGTPVSFTNKTDHQDINEILLKVVLNTIKPTKPSQSHEPQWVCKNIYRVQKINEEFPSNNLKDNKTLPLNGLAWTWKKNWFLVQIQLDFIWHVYFFSFPIYMIRYTIPPSPLPLLGSCNFILKLFTQCLSPLKVTSFIPSCDEEQLIFNMT